MYTQRGASLDRFVYLQMLVGEAAVRYRIDGAAGLVAGTNAKPEIDCGCLFTSQQRYLWRLVFAQRL